MEWSDIRIFLQVAREGSMTDAAASLRMDHSTISRRIARLERDGGVTLFERAGRRLTITEAGSRLAESAEKLESIVLREIMSLSEHRQAISGRVRIGATEEFGTHYLASRFARLAGGHPGLQLELVALPRTLSLATREVDILVTMDRPKTGDIRFKKLTEYEYGLFGTSSYFVGRPALSSIDELRYETLCGFIPELLHTEELDTTAACGGGASFRFRSASIAAQLEFVLSGTALAMLPLFVAQREPRLQRVLAENISASRSYYLAVHHDLAASPRVRMVIGAIEEQVLRDRRLFVSENLPTGGENNVEEPDSPITIREFSDTVDLAVV